MVSPPITTDSVWELLREIEDPEIPVINIVELGVIRDVTLQDEKVTVTITPTYSGCPAMQMIEANINAQLEQNGVQNFEVKTVISPAWTTDWLTDEAKQKLKNYGIAPPEKTTSDKTALFKDGQRKVACPFCDSENTELKSQFGATACKSLYFCNECVQPFEHFKCH